MSRPDTLTTTQPREETSTRRIPPYNVILENDDFHSFGFVVDVLQNVLGCASERAVQLTNQAHTSGRSIIWSGPKEVAELKAEQIHTCHEIREPGGKDLGPLGCSIEPAPGG